MFLSERFAASESSAQTFCGDLRTNVKAFVRLGAFAGCPEAEPSSSEGDVKGKTAVMFDDEVSTAGTLIEAAKVLEKYEAKNEDENVEKR